MELDTIEQKDCLDFLKSVPDASVDLITSDPPFEYAKGDDEAMRADGEDYYVWYERWIKECWRVLKPGHFMWTLIPRNRYERCLDIVRREFMVDKLEAPNVARLFKRLPNEHPNQTSTKTMVDAITTDSKPGDVVLDTFMGIGTTAVVAKAYDRHFIGCEINPERHASALKKLK